MNIYDKIIEKDYQFGFFNMFLGRDILYCCVSVAVQESKGFVARIPDPLKFYYNGVYS